MEHDIIYLPHTWQVIDMEKRKEILSRHKYHIWQGKNGFWYTYLDKDGVKKLTKRTTKEAVEDAIIDHVGVELSETIEQVFHEWNDWKVNCEKIEKSTHLRNQQCFYRHFKTFGKRKLCRVPPEEFTEFLEEQLVKFHMTAKSFSTLKAIVRGFLKRARKRHIISWSVENMLADMDISDRDFKQVHKEPEQEVFDVDEMKMMMTYLIENQDPKNLAILLMFVSGMRIGEVVALKPEDVGDKTIHVHRTETCYKDAKGKFIYEVRDRPKTQSGFRTVVVPETYEWVLRKIKLLNPFGEWVFLSDNGERMKECMVERRLEVLCAKLGMINKSPHKIRKTYVSILLDENIDARLVMDQVGHASITVSERNYHRNRKTTQKKQDMLSRIPEFETIETGGRKRSKNVIVVPKTGTFTG